MNLYTNIYTWPRSLWWFLFRPDENGFHESRGCGQRSQGWWPVVSLPVGVVAGLGFWWNKSVENHAEIEGRNGQSLTKQLLVLVKKHTCTSTETRPGTFFSNSWSYWVAWTCFFWNLWSWREAQTLRIDEELVVGSRWFNDLPLTLRGTD